MWTLFLCRSAQFLTEATERLRVLQIIHKRVVNRLVVIGCVRSGEPGPYLGKCSRKFVKNTKSLSVSIGPLFVIICTKYPLVEFLAVGL